METRVISGALDAIETELLVVGLFEGEPLPGSVRVLDGKLNNIILEKFETKEFSGEFRQFHLISTFGRISAKNVLLVGLGKRMDCTLELLRRASGHAARSLRDLFGFTAFAVALHDADVFGTSLKQRAQAVCEGCILGSYRFVKYKTVDVDKIKRISDISFVGDNISDAVQRGKILAGCECLTRDIVNEPPSVYTPEVMADEALKLERYGVRVTVLDKRQIEEKGLHALLAVNRGSAREPRFVVMEYDGGGSKKVALVGKGLTFDSGGLNIKPGESMANMKMDMAGAATVIAAVKACAQLKAKVNVVGVIACTENMPGEDAYKPGDVISTYAGKTIEVLNTDAEGRIVLADALAFAEKDVKPDVIVDLATLTGSVVVCLGHVCAGVLGDDAVVDRLKESGEVTGDRLWRLPLWQEYIDMVKSDIADVANIGKYKRSAGTIVGAAFLKAFVEKTPWAHIDTAGTAWSDEDVDYLSKGGTGFGVRLLVDFLEKFE